MGNTITKQTDAERVAVHKKQLTEKLPEHNKLRKLDGVQKFYRLVTTVKGVTAFIPISKENAGELAARLKKVVENNGHAEINEYYKTEILDARIMKNGQSSEKSSSGLSKIMLTRSEIEQFIESPDVLIKNVERAFGKTTVPELMESNSEKAAISELNK